MSITYAIKQVNIEAFIDRLAGIQAQDKAHP